MKGLMRKISKRAIVCFIAACTFVAGLVPLASVSAVTDTGFYKLSFDKSISGGQFYTLTDDLNVEKKNVSIRFRYYLEGEDDEISLVNLKNSNTLFSLKKGWNDCSVEEKEFSGKLCLGLRVTDATAKSGAVVYLKNVVITVGGESKFNINAEQYFASSPAKLECVNKADMPADEDESSKPAYLIDFDGAKVKARYCLSKDTWGASGKKVKIAFDYYITNAKDDEIFVENVAGGGGFLDDATKSKNLKAGKGRFSLETDSYSKGGLCVALESTSETVASKAKVYIWNVEITVGGENYFGIDVTQWGGEPRPTLTVIKYEDIPFPQVETGDTYLIDFDGAKVKARYCLSKDTWGASGKKVKIAFDYYITNAKDDEIFVENVAGGGGFLDDATKSKNLKAGKGRFSLETDSYSKGGLCVALESTSETVASKAKVYIWNVEITVGGENYFGIDVTQWGGEPRPTLTVMKYEDIPFEPDPGPGPSPEPKPEAADTWLIDFAGTQPAAYYCLSKDSWEVKGKPISISFSYHITDAATGELFVENVAGGGGFKDNVSQSKNLKKGRNTFNYSTDSYDRSGFCVGIKGSDDKTATKAKFYIWDVKITVDGKEYFDVNATQWYSKTPLPKLTAIKRSEVPADENTNGNSGSNGNSGGVGADAYLIDFAGTQPQAFYCISSDSWEAKNKAATVSFDYYMTDAESGELFVENVAGGGGFQDSKTNSTKLRKGKNSFSYSMTAYDRDGFCVGIKGSDEKKATKAKIYIWNVKITLGGENVFDIEAKQWQSKNPLPKASAVKYSSIPFKNETSASGSSYNGPDKYMLLQKNYCYVEGEGQKQFVSFAQYVGDAYNGSVVKPETTYVLSFDYYGDPGEFGTGVMGPAQIGIKSLDTGHNKTFPQSNMWMHYKEESGKYEGIFLPSVGYYHYDVEFTTLKNQTDFVFALESGKEGDAYYWNISITEKGKTQNLLTNSKWISDDLNDIGYWNIGATGWRTKQPDAGEKGNYVYSFVDFRDELTQLGEGGVIEETKDDDNSSKNNSKKPTVVPDNDEEEQNGLPMFAIILIIAGAVLVIGGTVTVILLNKKGIIHLKKSAK